MTQNERQDPLREWLNAPPFCIGEILCDAAGDGGFALCHRDDVARDDLVCFTRADAAAEIARYGDGGNYRPLKTAPNLRHGWRLLLGGADDVRLAVDLFYPARLAAYTARRAEALITTPLRETLDRQSGMYRVATGISDEQVDTLVANFCRSDGGCLRTILWQRDAAGTRASTQLPPEKFDARVDQTGRGARALPLLCQEACNLLVAEARNVVKSEQSR